MAGKCKTAAVKNDNGHDAGEALSKLARRANAGILRNSMLATPKKTLYASHVNLLPLQDQH